MTARLRDFEKRAANPVSVADGFCVGQSVDREILSELAVDEVVPVSSCQQDRTPPVDKDRGVAAVSQGYRLAVAVDVDAGAPSGPVTAVFQMAVLTVLPCQRMSRGSPTLTERRRHDHSLEATAWNMPQAFRISR